MNLSSLLHANLILKKDFKDADAMLDALVKAVYGEHELSIAEADLRREIYARISLGGTLFPTGIAIPHVRLDEINDLIIAIAIPEKPVAKDGTDIKMMVLMLTTKAAPKLYLNALASFAKISEDTDFFTRLCAAPVKNICAMVKEKRFELTDEITIGKIMNRDIVSLGPDNTAKEAADIFYQKRLSYMPVLDDKGDFVGEVSVLDLFALCIPDYALKLQNLKFLKNFEPLEEFIKKENNIKLKDIMKKPELFLDEDAPVADALLRHVQKKRRFLPVGKNGKLTGVVGDMDILHKVLRA